MWLNRTSKKFSINNNQCCSGQCQGQMLSTMSPNCLTLCCPRPFFLWTHCFLSDCSLEQPSRFPWQGDVDVGQKAVQTCHGAVLTWADLVPPLRHSLCNAQSGDFACVLLCWIHAATWLVQRHTQRAAKQLSYHGFFPTISNAGAEKGHLVDTCKSNRAKAQDQGFCAHAAKFLVQFLVLSQDRAWFRG